MMDDFISPKLRVVTTYSRGRTLVASSPEALKSSGAKRSLFINKGELLLREKPIAARLINDVTASNICKNKVSESNVYVQFMIEAACTIEKDVGAYEKVQALCSNLNRRCKSDLDDIRRYARIVAARTNSSNTNYEWLVDRLQSNAFGITDREMNVIGFGLYANAAILNHSCDPNCIQYFEGSAIHIRSLRDIAAGEEVTIAYIDVAEPTHSRQEQLLRTYAFMCSCSKCSVSDLFGFKCRRPGCRGAVGLSQACSAQQYISWLHKGKTASVMPTTTSEELVRFLKSFPVDIIEYISVSPESGSIAVSSTYSQNNSAQELGLVCSTCNNSVTLPELCKDLNRLFRLWRVVREEKTLSSLIKYFDGVASLLGPMTYMHMDAASRVALALIGANRYEEALRVSMACVKSFRALYPRHFPIVAIQEFQVAKLLALLKDVPRAREHIQRALTALRVALGSRDALTQEAEYFASTL